MMILGTEALSKNQPRERTANQISSRAPASKPMAAQTGQARTSNKRINSFKLTTRSTD